MQKNIFSVLMYVILVFFFACKPSVDREKLKKELLDLHQTQIQAHWKKDIDFFTKDLADDYWQVADGEVYYPEEEEITERFSNYLNTTTFTTYEDIEAPIVKISDDGSMAWIIVQVKIEGDRQVSDSTRHMDFTCAWIALYNREDGKWIRQGEVSTFK